MPRLLLKELLELSDAGVWGDEDTINGISVLRSTNFCSNGRIDFENLALRRGDEPKRTQKILREGDILLEKSGGGPKQPVGRVCLFRGHVRPHAFGNFLSRLRPRMDIVDPEYLFYRLWHFHAVGLTTSYQKQTSGIRNLETKRYLELPIELPPLSDQRRDVDLLSRAESIIRMRQEAEHKINEIIPALFLDMFGDPATNQRGWPVRRFGDIAERFEGGKNVQAGSANDSKYRILKISAVTSGIFNESESKPAPRGFDPPARYFVRVGDILFSRANTEALVGATALVSWTDGRSLLPDKLWRLVWRGAENVSPSYMLALLQDKSVRKSLSKIASGTGGQ